MADHRVGSDFGNQGVPKHGPSTGFVDVRGGQNLVRAREGRREAREKGLGGRGRRSLPAAQAMREASGRRGRLGRRELELRRPALEGVGHHAEIDAEACDLETARLDRGLPEQLDGLPQLLD